MIRYLGYGIPFGDKNGFQLSRKLRLMEGPDLAIREEYQIEGPVHDYTVGFTPGELAELHAAIHEMLRMCQQHRDALTDGAGTDEALTAAERDLLDNLANRHHLIYRTHDLFQQLQDRGWIELLAVGGALTDTREYTISDKGRALLEAQEPSAAASTVGEADLVSADDVKLLRMLSEGVTLKMGHPALGRFRNRGWVEVTAETGAFPTWSSREYCITDAGRRVLAERDG